MVLQMEDMGCIGGIVLVETIRSLDRAALGFDDWTVSPIILQVSFRHTRVYLLGLTHCTWYCTSCVLRQMGIDQTVPIMDDISADSTITPGVTRTVLRAWVRDHHMVTPLPNPASVQTSPQYRTWFIAAVWVQADADDEVGIGEEIVLAPRTGEVGQSLTARDESEDVAPRSDGTPILL
ncbi:hypothetical protein JCGZ_26471 [Jatropha curcas]|uniref:Uncharacterized protein n=1 Tax=Jatropha curcas TaxID=180498 RepID=A0A067L4I1_JATCU|nr:hypothetical protein JCGZ_26471 [Jatropha curcas]